MTATCSRCGTPGGTLREKLDKNLNPKFRVLCAACRNALGYSNICYSHGYGQYRVTINRGTKYG